MHRQTRFLAVLESALGQPVEDREAFVHANSGDRWLAEEVLQSLDEMDDLGDFLERPAVVVSAAAEMP